MKNPPARPARFARRSLGLALFAATGCALPAQIAPAASKTPANDEVVALTPFTVVADPSGYQVSTSTTGTRLNTALKDVPQSLSILTKDFLEDTMAVTLEDAVTFVTNVQPRQNLADGLMIRGVQTTRKYYNNYLVPSFVAGLANVSRIEILKGPASAIYGRGELGGVINYVSLQPSEQVRRNARVTVASYDHFDVKADSTGPVPSVKGLSYRLSGNYLTTGEIIDFAKTRQSGLYPSLKYRLGPSTEIVYDGIYFTGTSPANEGTPFLTSRSAGAPANMPEVFASRNLNTSGAAGNQWDSRDFDVNMHFLSVAHSVGKFFHVRQGFTYYERTQDISKMAISNLMRRNATTGDITLSRAPTRTLAHEEGITVQTDFVAKYGFLRGTRLASQHETLAGGEFVDTNADSQRWPGTVGDLSVFTPDYTQTVIERAQDTDTTNTRKSYGYFAHHISKFARDRLQLSVSWRWDDETTASRNLRTGTRSATDPKATDAPRFGLAIRPIESLTLYALRSEQSDPVTTTRVWVGLPGNHPNFDDRFSSQVVGKIDEVGAKMELFDRKLSLTFAYFKMARDGLIRPSALTPAEYAFLGVPLGTAGYNRNLLVLGEESTGFEFEWFGQLTPRLAIFGGYGHLKTEAETLGVRGPTRGIPEFKLTSFLKYDLRERGRGGWDLRLGAAVLGPQYANQNTELGARHKTSVRLDAGATYEFARKYSVSFQIKNLTDATQVISAVAAGSNRLAPPRELWMTFGVRL